MSFYLLILITANMPAILTPIVFRIALRGDLQPSSPYRASTLPDSLKGFLMLTVPIMVLIIYHFFFMIYYFEDDVNDFSFTAVLLLFLL